MSARSRFATVAGLGGVALAAAGLLWVLPSLVGLAGGTAPEVASVLAHASRPPVVLPIPGSEAPLVGHSLHFERVTVADEGLDRARAVSTLDFEGTLGSIRVSSLGRETTHFQRNATGWQLEGSLTPTLAGVLSALVARRLALQTSNAAALGELHTPADREEALAEPALRARLAHPVRNGAIQAWYMRFEAGEVTVTEEEEPPKQLHRLRLVPRAPASLEFVFAGSLL
ncbi:MAG: hypothetical protein ACLQDQ_11110 [Myxococcaceae bacterium]